MHGGVRLFCRQRASNEVDSAQPRVAAKVNFVTNKC